MTPLWSADPLNISLFSKSYYLKYNNLIITCIECRSIDTKILLLSVVVMYHFFRETVMLEKATQSEL
jgi:hypothetical protein